jgi:hypothetical protein
LQDDFNFCLGHRFPQIPMDDRTAIAMSGEGLARYLNRPVSSPSP